GAVELLAVARAAVNELRAESGDLPGDGELARGGVHGTGGGGRERAKVAHALKGGFRLHASDGDGALAEAHVVAAQIDRRRGRRRPEGQQQCREDEPADRPMLHRGSPVTSDGLCPAKGPYRLRRRGVKGRTRAFSSFID